MRQVSFALCLAVAVGCNGFSPSPFVPDQPSPPVLGAIELPQLIQIGEPVDVTIPSVRDAYNFTLTAPANGRLTVRVTWDAAKDDFLQIGVRDIIFPVDDDPSSYSTVDGKRSLAGSVSVTSGGVYRIWVANVPSPWDYGSSLYSSFTLTTSIQ